MNFFYRFVPYGTRFVDQEGQRQGTNAEAGRANRDGRGESAAADMAGREAAERRRRLYRNELAVDVGGECWGYAGSDRAVVDHHFFRTDGGQFPSASAGVLHRASLIRSRFAEDSGDFWLVAHRNPDFDAFCAMYLARCLLEGEIAHDGWEEFGLRPDGWFGGPEEIAWTNPHIERLPAERRWPVLLAAFASCVDLGRRLSCPREQSLHSVLYAALVRGRAYRGESSGAVEFFDEVRRALERQQLNPLYDAVLEDSVTFAPELRLLARDGEAYERDIRRARRCVVYIQKAADDSLEWFDKLQSNPLFDSRQRVNSEHLRPPGHGFEQVDGIFIRDPESLLFKEWARGDADNSSMGGGFLFTAVAHSGGRPAGRFNTTDYYFALDPERAGRLHLYNVWARLQAAEIERLFSPECAAVLTERRQAARPPRPGFEGVAGAPSSPLYPLFSDPWYDGRNSRCTIVPTPDRETLLPPGAASDLGDDPVAALVQEELESAVFASPAQCTDFAASAGVGARPEHEVPAAAPQRGIATKSVSAYRFCRVRLDDGVETAAGRMAEQIGRVLWRVLHPEAGLSVPPEFAEQHVLKGVDWVGVWSLRGVAVAYKSPAEGRVTASAELFAQLASLARGLEELTREMRQADESPTGRRGDIGPGEDTPSRTPPPVDESEAGLAPYGPVLRRGERLMEDLGKAETALASTDNRLVARFLQAGRLHEVLRTLRDVYLAAVGRAQAGAQNRQLHEVAELQSKVEWLEIFIAGVYAVELAAHVAESLNSGDTFVGVSLLILAVFVPAVLIWLLRPQRHKGVRLRRLTVAAALIGVALALFVAGLVRRGVSDHTVSDSKEATPDTKH
jgi:hypothetical protein